MSKLRRLLIEDGAIAPQVMEFYSYKKPFGIRHFVISDEYMDRILKFLDPPKKKRRRKK